MEGGVSHRPLVYSIFLFFPTLDAFLAELSSQTLGSGAGVQSPRLVLIGLLVCDVLGPWSRGFEAPLPWQLVSLLNSFLLWARVRPLELQTLPRPPLSRAVRPKGLLGSPGGRGAQACCHVQERAIWSQLWVCRE